MFSCPSPPRELSLSVIPHVPGHLSVQYTVLRAPQWEVSKGITLCQDPFLSSVGNGQSLEQEISYSISKASFCISGVPTSGCELCPCLRVEEEGSVSPPALRSCGWIFVFSLPVVFPPASYTILSSAVPAQRLPAFCSSFSL